mmetsp:Transcript_13068/g.40253  ORF Transcript_13068/g.40253 Transcript_13068/m.40253 type:complete len:451 (+) Transcript_13068:179-1531(+)
MFGRTCWIACWSAFICSTVITAGQVGEFRGGHETAVSKFLSSEVLRALYGKYFDVNLAAEALQRCSATCHLTEDDAFPASTSVKITQGFYWEDARLSSFDPTFKPLACKGATYGAGVPRCQASAPYPQLATLQSVLMVEPGTIFQCNGTSGSVVEIGGGCCMEDWKRYKGHKVQASASNTSARLHRAFSLLQHHGHSLFHVVNEVVPRLLTYYTFLLDNPDVKILVSAVRPLPTIFVESFGFSADRVVRVGLRDVVRVGELYVPPPVFQERRYYPRCALVAARDFLVSIVDSVEQRSTVRNKIVLLERATRRTADGKCHSTRCMQNFVELKTSIEKEFKDSQHEVVVFPPSGLYIQDVVHLFRDAVAVVGIHGAAFTNVLFCRPGTHILHVGSPSPLSDIGPGWYRTFASTFNLTYYGLEATADFNRESFNVGVDVQNITSLLREKLLNG